MSYSYNFENGILTAVCDRCGVEHSAFSPQGRLPENWTIAMLEFSPSLSEFLTFKYCFCEVCSTQVEFENIFNFSESDNE